MSKARASDTPALAGRTILQVIPALSAGGAERTAIDVAAAIVRAGGRALVASQGGRLRAELERAGGELVELPLKSKNPGRIIANIARLERLIRAERVDLVHARSRAPAWSACFAARRCGVPFVTTYHGLYTQKGRVKALYNSVMARGVRVIANSHFTKAAIVSRHAIRPERVVVIHRGTDFSRFDPQAVSPQRIERLRSQWHLPQDAFIILMPARFTTLKGHEVCIRAAAALRESAGRPFVFVMAGETEGREAYVAELEALIRGLGLEAETRLERHCTDMPAAYALADVVISASTQPETFGRVAVEAQAMRTPVIVTELGAVAETVLAPPRVEEEERTGWLVPPGDAEALAGAIGTVMRLDANRRDMLGAQARAHVLKHFALETMTGATLQLYAAVLAEAGRRQPGNAATQPVAGKRIS